MGCRAGRQRKFDTVAQGAGREADRGASHLKAAKRYYIGSRDTKLCRWEGDCDVSTGRVVLTFKSQGVQVDIMDVAVSIVCRL